MRGAGARDLSLAARLGSGPLGVSAGIVGLELGGGHLRMRAVAATSRSKRGEAQLVDELAAGRLGGLCGV